MCFKHVHCLKIPKKTVGLYSEVDKTSTQVQSAEQVVKKLHVEQEHHVQESTLHRQLKVSSIFTNTVFCGTEFNFVVIKFSKIKGCQAQDVLVQDLSLCHK